MKKNMYLFGVLFLLLILSRSTLVSAESNVCMEGEGKLYPYYSREYNDFRLYEDGIIYVSGSITAAEEDDIEARSADTVLYKMVIKSIFDHETVYSKKITCEEGRINEGKFSFELELPEGWYTFEIISKKVDTLYSYIGIAVSDEYPYIEEKIDEIEMVIGETMDMHLDVHPARLYSQMSWSSSDPSVATVDEEGRVTALGEGFCNIVASINGTSVSTRVCVEKAYLELNYSEYTMFQGQKSKLEVVACRPLYMNTSNVEWISSDENVVTVNSNGRITAVGTGEAIVYARVENGDTDFAKIGQAEAVCDISVKPQIELSNTQKALYATDSFQLSVNWDNPNDSKLNKVIWSSTNEKVAKVNSKGVVKGIAEGNADIIVECNGSRGVCSIDVRTVTGNSNCVPLIVDKVANKAYDKGEKHYTLTNKLKGGKRDEYAFSLKEETTIAIVLTSLSDNNNPRGLWYSLDSDYSRLLFTDKSEYVIIETFEAGEHSIDIINDSYSSYYNNPLIEYKIKIYKVSEEYETVNLSSSKKTVEVGAPTQLRIINNLNYVVNNNDIKWSSSDTKIATVDQNGKVTANKAGTCSIIASLPKGEKLTCKVTVSDKVPVEQKMGNCAVFASFTRTDLSRCNWLLVNQSNKDIVNFICEVIIYDKNGKNIPCEYNKYKLSLSYNAFMSGNALKAADPYNSVECFVATDILYGYSYPTKGRVCIISATFSDGTTWENPYYQEWSKKYSGKSY